MNLGTKIKVLRKSRGITLQQLSEATGLSIGYLSNLERDSTSPTISSLLKICEVFNVDLSSFLSPLPEEKIIVKKDERREIFYSDTSKVKFEAISEKTGMLKGYCITIKPGGNYGEISRGHLQDELSMVIQGTMMIDVCEEKYVLNEGDTIYIEANAPHQYQNIGDTDCIFYCALA